MARRPLTDKQREARSFANAAGRVEKERRTTAAHTEHQKRATATHKTGLRRDTYKEETDEKSARRQEIHALALNRNKKSTKRQRETAQKRADLASDLNAQRAVNQAALTQQRAEESRRSRAFSEQLKGGSQGDLEGPPQVSFAGGVIRSIFMAIVLVVVYALVTHSDKSSTAIGNVGGIFGKLTSTEPLFKAKTASGP